ncbi:MAG: flagellar biosynthesis anti-sigma factor FlgM [Silvanigrellaceae bacterium]|nr:flagellar biosynthesis anti-sigma factor FlgM [Silvanigrellaceae bacterium]
MVVSNVNNTPANSNSVAIKKDVTKTGEKPKVSSNANAYAKTAQAGATASSPPSVKDAAKVQISPEAKKMSEISLAKKIIDDTPDIRDEKVLKLKEQIAKGEYQVDAGKVANGIAREALFDELAQNPNVLG